MLVSAWRGRDLEVGITDRLAQPRDADVMVKEPQAEPLAQPAQVVPVYRPSPHAEAAGVCYRLDQFASVAGKLLGVPCGDVDQEFKVASVVRPDPDRVHRIAGQGGQRTVARTISARSDASRKGAQRDGGFQQGKVCNRDVQARRILDGGVVAVDRRCGVNASAGRLIRGWSGQRWEPVLEQFLGYRLPG